MKFCSNSFISLFFVYNLFSKSFFSFFILSNFSPKSFSTSALNENDSFKTVSIDEDGRDYLQTVFRNGELLIDDKFSNIKNRALNYSKRW